MNTAERRWVIVAPAHSPSDWDRLFFTLADFPVEAIVELDTQAEIYFADVDDAAACAQALRLADPPRPSSLGTGEVFGQSSHPTTELCLELLPREPARRVADIGSGTGRLAAEAARRNSGVNAPALTVAVDVDWPAAMATHASLQDAPNAFTLQASADALASGAFNLILANLHLSLWRDLAPEITRIAARGAQLVASGFLDTQRAEVEELLAANGWRITARKSSAGWLAVRAERSV